MIEIIKEGKKQFVVVCPNCDAIYSYELSDIVGRSTRCPCCGDFCQHYNHIKAEREDTE